MRIILNETIESLGIIGSEVIVSDGYARNYLLPKKKAVTATPSNRKMIDQRKKKVDLQIAKEKGLAEEMAKNLEGVGCKILAKVSQEDRLYGSVTARDILDAMEKQGVKIEKQMLLLSEPIKTLGTFKVPVRIYKGVEVEITVEVVPE
jgi:large subunit ribosomal protein L9